MMEYMNLVYSVDNPLKFDNPQLEKVPRVIGGTYRIGSHSKSSSHSVA